MTSIGYDRGPAVAEAETTLSVADREEVHSGKPVGLSIRASGPSRALRHFGRSATRIVVLLVLDTIALSLGVGLFDQFLVRSVPMLANFPGLGSVWGPLVPGVLGLMVAGAYRSGQAWLSFWRLFKAGLFAGLILGWTGFWTGEPGLGLGVVMVMAVLVVVFCGLTRSAVWVGIHYFGYGGLDQEKVVVLVNSTDPESADAIDRIRSDAGFDLLHVMDANGGRPRPRDQVMETLWAEFGDFAPDTIVVVGQLEQAWFEGVVELAALTGLRLLSLPRYASLGALKERIIWRRGVSYLELTTPAFKGGQLFVKRLIDVMGAGVGLVLLFPLLAVLAALIKVDSRGAILFRQIRVGQEGRRFLILKFRTMGVDADEVKDELQHLNRTGDPRFFKIPDDPRMTRIGRFLRAWSLDELPQLWNVFRGDMSLVGPRPFPESDLQDYLDHHFDRLAVRPGITGLWQVGGRNEVQSFDEVVRLDRKYIDTWTLGLDLAILIKTIPVVLKKRGAH